MLCSRRSLAKISVTPGKTQTINHFLINLQWYLVDLPGYGYAKRSKKSRESWKKMIDAYLLNRTNLMTTFVLADLRIPPQNIDLEVISGFGENQLPMALIFTKYDKLKPDEAENNLRRYQSLLLESWETLPPYFVTSSKSGKGRDDLLVFIAENNRMFHEASTGTGRPNQR